jgi:hypothetical protein
VSNENTKEEGQEDIDSNIKDYIIEGFYLVGKVPRNMVAYARVRNLHHSLRYLLPLPFW